MPRERPVGRVLAGSCVLIRCALVVTDGPSQPEDAAGRTAVGGPAKAAATRRFPPAGRDAHGTDEDPELPLESGAFDLRLNR